MLNWDIENKLRLEGYKIICGCDEAGRGPLAGAVAAAACILPNGLEIKGLNDSKKLSEKKREELFDVIKEASVACAVATCSVEEIEQYNILECALMAMRRAVEQLDVSPEFILVDGNINRGFTLPSQAVIGGDAKSPNIAAASILAKVTRDRLCYELDEKYPQYGFAKHKGYATKEHREAILKYGPCPEHRSLFLRKLLNKDG
ncbi:MAG: ribonuclease HII [Ruminococcaceae bacterium]|nr:ribonuclease HII [Oscillospiraceae bacterium]